MLTQDIRDLVQDVRELENENYKLKEALKQCVAEQVNKPMSCGFCKFYIQHYIKLGSQYRETNCGHCTHGQCKKRKPGDSCKYFELGKYQVN